MVPPELLTCAVPNCLLTKVDAKKYSEKIDTVIRRREGRRGNQTAVASVYVLRKNGCESRFSRSTLLYGTAARCHSHHVTKNHKLCSVSRRWSDHMCARARLNAIRQPPPCPAAPYSTVRYRTILRVTAAYNNTAKIVSEKPASRRP